MLIKMNDTPRSKSTFQPQKRLYEALSRIANGDTEIKVERENGFVRITGNGVYHFLSAEHYDKYMRGDYKGSNIRLIIPQDWQSVEMGRDQ